MPKKKPEKAKGTFRKVKDFLEAEISIGQWIGKRLGRKKELLLSRMKKTPQFQNWWQKDFPRELGRRHGMEGTWSISELEDTRRDLQDHLSRLKKEKSQQEKIDLATAKIEWLKKVVKQENKFNASQLIRGTKKKGKLQQFFEAKKEYQTQFTKMREIQKSRKHRSS